MTPEEIIGQSRELDPSFTQQRHPRRVALNYLSRLQRRLVGEWAKHEEVAAVDTFTVSFPLVDFYAGVELIGTEESLSQPIEMTAIQRPLSIFTTGDVNDPRDLELIRWGDRNRKRYGRAAYVRENRLFFTGRLEDYVDVDRVELTYTLTPADLADQNEPLVLPQTAEETLVSWLGAFMAKRSKEAELARPRREFIQDAIDAEALWIDELQRREGATISRTKEVW